MGDKAVVGMLEKVFSDQYQDFHHSLKYLLSEDNRAAEVSDRDELVAATVIQWLGSPMGQNFLRRCLLRSKGTLIYRELEKHFESS